MYIPGGNFFQPFTRIKVLVTFSLFISEKHLILLNSLSVSTPADLIDRILFKSHLQVPTTMLTLTMIIRRRKIPPPPLHPFSYRHKDHVSQGSTVDYVRGFFVPL